MRALRLVGPRGLLLSTFVPTTRRERLTGLIGRRCLAPGEALLLERTRSIHTFGMRFSILAALLDDDLAVLDVRRMPPNRLLLPRRRVRHVLECSEQAEVLPGDRLVLAPVGRPSP
jgi:uncharacterized membrane protein (UPF0127 family)